MQVLDVVSVSGHIVDTGGLLSYDETGYSLAF